MQYFFYDPAASFKKYFGNYTKFFFFFLWGGFYILILAYVTFHEITLLENLYYLNDIKLLREE